MTLPEYLKLKNDIIVAVSQAEKYPEILSALKETFKDEINSVRRFEQIKTIGRLLNVLEVRDLLSEDQIQCLKTVAQKVPNSRQLLDKIADYEEHHLPQVFENYYLPVQISKTDQEESLILDSKSPLGNNISLRKKERIFKTIIQEIGCFWRDLGRNLKIRECDIDDIHYNNRSLPDKAAQIMHIFEYSKADPDRWFFNLCDALEKSRRKDLARSIQEIMTMNF